MHPPQPQVSRSQRGPGLFRVRTPHRLDRLRLLTTVPARTPDPITPTAAKSTSKPARKATGKGRSNAAQERSRPAANEMGRDQDDDDDDELGMRSDDAEERDGADGEAEGDETTVVAETQFGAGSEPTATGKKGKAAAAAAGKRRPAAGATQGKKQALVEEFGDDLAAAGLAAPKSSAREKKLEAQLALVRCGGPFHSGRARGLTQRHL